MVRKQQPLFAPETPGEILKRYIINEKGITQDVLASAMGVSRLSINQIVNNKRSITAEMALRLARVLNTTPDFWLNLQRDVDLFEAQQKIDVLKLPVLRSSQKAA